MEDKNERIVNFSEKLFKLDVSEIPRQEVPEIINPNTGSRGGTVVCYDPTNEQLIQLGLIIWQTAIRAREALRRGTQRYKLADTKVSQTRHNLKRLLLPYVEGDMEKAMDLCISLLIENKETLDKYIEGWSLISKPNSVWVDEDTNGIFLCENRGRILVGLSPWDYVFVYNPKK